MNNGNEPLCPRLTKLDYSLVDKVVNGLFSKVFKCWDKSKPHKDLPRKRIHISSAPQSWKEKCIKLELKVLKKVKQPNIFNVHHLIKTRRTVFMMEQWITQILSALSFCHSKGVAHRDLKLDNFLLNLDLNALLSDFGVSCITYDKSGEMMRNTSYGEPAYMASDVEPQTKIWPFDAKAADMYTIGICLYQTLYFDKPFNESLALNNPIAHVLKQRITHS